MIMDDDLKYLCNPLPLCPGCDYEIDPSRFDMDEIRDDGEHCIDCPRCEVALVVSTSITHSFSTYKDESNNEK